MRSRLTRWLTASAAAALLLSPALAAHASTAQVGHKKTSRAKASAHSAHSAHHPQVQPRPAGVAKGKAAQEGDATGEGRISYYHAKFTGRRTASGERYDPSALTMAHRQLPMGTLVRVTNLKNQHSVVLRVNDRGPWVRGRIADVTHAAAVKLDFLRSGLAKVRLEVVGQAGGRRSARIADTSTGPDTPLPAGAPAEGATPSDRTDSAVEPAAPAVPAAG